jgi:hypothetical protein
VAQLRIASFNVPDCPFDWTDQKSMQGADWGRNSFQNRKHMAARQITNVAPTVMGLQEIRDRSGGGESVLISEAKRKEKAKAMRISVEELGDEARSRGQTLSELIALVHGMGGGKYKVVDRCVYEPIIYDSTAVTPLWRGSTLLTNDQAWIEKAMSTPCKCSTTYSAYEISPLPSLLAESPPPAPRLASLQARVANGTNGLHHANAAWAPTPQPHTYRGPRSGARSELIVRAMT